MLSPRYGKLSDCGSPLRFGQCNHAQKESEVTQSEFLFIVQKRSRQRARFSPCTLLSSVSSEPFRLPQHLWKGNLSIRPQHLLIAHAAHLLIRRGINIRITGENVVHHIVFHGLLEQQPADAVAEHTKDRFKRLAEDLRQKITCVFALQIAAVEQNCLFNELVLRAASISFVVFLHPLPDGIVHPDRVPASFFCFRVQNLLKSE